MNSQPTREVQFEVDGTTTYGTLHVPARHDGQRLAAALLLAGSGPTDRDGNVPGLGVLPQTLGLLAAALGELGIMSLRFDKYFSGQTGGGAYAGDPAALDLAAYLRQAAAAYDVLGGQPEASRTQMLIAGHSEGGMYALLLAPSVRPAPAGLALIEPQADRLLSLIQRQTHDLLDAARKAGTITPEAAAQDAAAVEQAIGQFRAGHPVVTSALSPDVARIVEPELLSAANARYVRSDDAVDPAAAAARVAPGTRVLVTAGTRDTRVPMPAVRSLAAALAGAGTTGPGLVELEGTEGQKDIERTRALLRLASSMGSAVDRFSIIALNSLNRIHDGFTPEELLRVECVPQNKEAAQAGRYLKSNAGRARAFAHKRAGELVTEQQSSTIACVSGFLVNMVDSSVRLISPCNASERWPLGYWVLASGEFGSAGELRDLLRSMIDEHVRDGLSVLDMVRLRRDVRMVVEPDRLQVISPGLGLAFDGQPMAGELAALLADGTHTVEQVALRRRSTARVAPIETLAVLDRLFAQGFFDEEPPAAAEGPEMLPLEVTGRASR